MEPLDYLKAVGRRWRVVLGCMLLAAVGSYLTAPDPATAEAQPRSFVTHTATATLLAEPEAAVNLRFTQLFMRRGDLPTIVADTLGRGQSGPEVAAQATIEIDDGVGTLSITSTHRDPTVLETFVNTYAEQSITYFDQQVRTRAQERAAALQPTLDELSTDLAALDVQARTAGEDSVLTAQRAAKQAQYQSVLQEQEALLAGPQDSGLSLLEAGVALEQGATALAPPSDRTRRTALGLVAGGLLGILLALVADRFDTRVRGRRETQEITTTSVLAEVPRLRTTQRRGGLPVVLREPGGAYAEAHRSLRSALSLLPAHSIGRALADTDNVKSHAPPSRVVLLVSARAGEGKSTTLINLAATIGAAGRTVIAVDADLHHPSLGSALGVPGGLGIADLASGDSRESVGDVSALLRPTRLTGVRLLDAGTPGRYASVSPARMADAVGRARGLADVVLVDVAPLLGASDVLDLIAAVDSALLVVRAGRTSRDQLHHATEVLARTQVPVIGSVLVGAAGVRGGAFRHSSEGLGWLAALSPFRPETPRHSAVGVPLRDADRTEEDT